MAEPLAKIYEPKSIEAKASQIWLAGNFFAADAAAASAKGSYTIVIPPPNVTAALHLGHALNNTLQDILIRFRRMQQFNTLWMPGTDHAGIATQTVVEKRLLAEEGKRRTDYERDEFVGRVQAWKDEYEGRILGQLKSMGCSCDWGRTRFTMDEVCAKAVRANFFNLFKDGLIYRGKRLVNWDPATQTVLADDEVEHETVHGHFWYLRYPLVEPVEIDGQIIDHVTVATTRPETMLGDTAIAMNPSDPRVALVGKQVRLPIVGRIIPIIADEHVVLPDPESEDEKAKFSTGFLKVTPAHDPDDRQIGLRHDLEIINVMAPDGSISDKHGWEDAATPEAQSLLGMDRFEAREAIVEWFRTENLLEDVREYTHEVGHSYRSHVPIEPYLSDQWYIAVKKPIDHLAEKFGAGLIEGTDIPANSLAGLALKPLLDERLRFIPPRYAKTYQTWLEDLRDWPISRQLWWGHRIPIWSSPNQPKEVPQIAVRQGTDENGETVYYTCLRPGCEAIERQLEAEGCRRDPDVLDTWFSSALWPFSTLGWPDDVPEMKAFYPGDVLCTAREIITLWVSRMVMMGQYCAGDIPFKDVYIHAMIQDGQGRKMSKSLGNGIDPLVAIDSHGADAMRFTLASMTTDTQDIRMPVAPMELPDGRTVNTSPKFDIGRNFCNKLWNASRFAMMNLDGADPEKFDAEKMDLTDKWILSRLTRTIIAVSEDLEQFKYNEPLNAIYRFFWNDLCDWYLEWVKPRIQDEEQKPIAQNVLAFALDQTLRLLHPFIPFITEGIFQNLNSIAPVRKLNALADAPAAEAIIIAQWPQAVRSLIDEQTERQISAVQNCIRAIREIRNKYNIAPTRKLNASAKAPQAAADILNQNADLIGNLAGVEQFSAATDMDKAADSAAAIIEDVQIYVHGVIDPQAERKRLEKKKQQLENGIKPLLAKLGNENFVTRAKPQVVEQAGRRLKELTEQLEAVDKHLAEL
ncbi:MAG: valine--tRNA ligase [Planctomycetota bacterium]|nr:MAG: valine--tRNA ligase [Planctomycetota bacterium]